MTGGSVSFTLDDGDMLRVPDEDLRQIYESLWKISHEPGAVSTAALVMDVSRLHPYARVPVALTAPQTAVLRKAVALLHAY
jgi:hypothetical protein